MMMTKNCFQVMFDVCRYRFKISSLLCLIFTNYIFADTLTMFEASNIKEAQGKISKLKITYNVADASETLYINGKAVNLLAEGDSYVLSVLASASIADKDIYLIWGGIGATPDSYTTIHCKFLTVTPNDIVHIGALTYCPVDNGLKLQSDQIVVKYSKVNMKGETYSHGRYVFDPKTDKVLLLH